MRFARTSSLALALTLCAAACSSTPEAEPRPDVERAGAADAADPDDPADTADPGSEAGLSDLDHDEASDAASAGTTAVAAGQRVLEALAASLTPREKALQLLVVSAWGADPLTAIASELGTECVGGVFVAKGFEHWNPPESKAAAAQAIAAISQGSSDCAAPPLIASDAEPGTAILKVPVDPLPDPAALAAGSRSEPDASAAIAGDSAAFAAEIRKLGVHVNFGVVADVDAGPDYFMASVGRTFGGDPAAVSAVAAALVEGHCRSGVAAALKHFPNQGSTVEDPHLADSYSTNDPAAWAQHGRLPYTTADAPLVMTGHVRYRGVDGAAPASLSSEVTTGWLRDGLGYDGVIISDDLFSMSGAGAELAIPDRGVAAILAGNDMALYLEVSGVAEAVDELTRLIGGDDPAARQLEASVRRVLTLKAALGLLDGIEAVSFPLCGD